MKNLEINFDVIDKTYEARGEHNVRRWLRTNKIYDVAGSILPLIHLSLALSGAETPQDALVNSAISLSCNVAIWGSLDTMISLLKTKMTGLNYKQRAYFELLILSLYLNEQGINISVDNMMKANVYHKDYKLSKESTPGIIRERYFEVPVENKDGEEETKSIKETHLLGSKKYILSFDKPAEQRQYKLAYNM